jgi:polysaccharide export outer membrane protein
MVSRGSWLVFGVFLITLAAMGQIPLGGQNAPPIPAQSINPLRPDYELGSNDQVYVTAPNVPELNGRPYRIDSEGFIDFGTLVGRIHAGGLTVRALETVITTQLRDFVRDPQVSITVTIYRTDPVVFYGAFRSPGYYALQGGRTLSEMLAVAGGLLPTASRRIKITRRIENGPIPLPNAEEDPTGKVSSAEINLDTLTQNINPAEDIVLKVYDLISSETARPVYVHGEVTRPIAIQLGEQPSISVTQALTQAGGFTLAASRGKVRILRPILGTSKLAEMVVDLNRIYQGKDNDVPLLPNDELYVPRASTRVLLTPVATGILTSLPYLMISLAISGVF